jgi:hypothetical protein
VAHKGDIGTKFALDLSNTRNGEWIHDLHERLSGNAITPSDSLLRQQLVVEYRATGEKSYVISRGAQRIPQCHDVRLCPASVGVPVRDDEDAHSPV